MLCGKAPFPLHYGENATKLARFNWNLFSASPILIQCNFTLILRTLRQQVKSIGQMWERSKFD